MAGETFEDHSRLMCIGADRDDLARCANLAHAQLIAEDLRDSDPAWKAVICRPDDAMPADQLRTMLVVFKSFGVEPDEDSVAENTKLLASGYLFKRWGA